MTSLHSTLAETEIIKLNMRKSKTFTFGRPVQVRLRLVFSIQNLTRLVTSFSWLRNGIDQAVS